MTAPRPLVPAFTGIYDAFEPLALPLLRFVLGMILVPHGCQKLFGWFGGMGFEKFTELFDKLGRHPAVFWLSLVAATEFLGGLMLAFGFLTRFAAAAIFIFMLNAIWFTGNSSGFFWNKGGLEYPLLIGAAALVFLIRGGGKYSIDRAIGREL
jgi:putative oxidoreductase